LQEVPFDTTGLLQTPVEGLQVPTLWHWSLTEQVTGFAPMQAPAWHVSVCVQALPSLQEVPFDAADHIVVLAAGTQTWQVLAGFTVPAAYCEPLMVQVAAEPQTFAVPPPPHVWGSVQVPQLIVPLQLSEIVPQLSPAGQEVKGTHSERAGEGRPSAKTNPAQSAVSRITGTTPEQRPNSTAEARSGTSLEAD
jgi:hypothetical protein